jgi:hypothetical protein
MKDYMSRLASDLGIDECDVYPADYFDLMGGVGFGGYVEINGSSENSPSLLDSSL